MLKVIFLLGNPEKWILFYVPVAVMFASIIYVKKKKLDLYEIKVRVLFHFIIICTMQVL